MPASPENLFAFLDQLHITHHTIDHPPVFTADEAAEGGHEVPGLACKNLFLKDKRGVLWLIVMPAKKRADLASIAKKTGASKLSFGNSELLLEKLGVSPGSVTPFALLNDTQKAVKVVLDQDMMAGEKVNYHPLRNTASTAIDTPDLLKFLQALEREPIIIDCGVA